MRRLFKMAEHKKWLTDKLEDLFKDSQDYKQKALIKAAKGILEEQEQRKEQLQGELDGSLWSPRDWG